MCFPVASCAPNIASMTTVGIIIMSFIAIGKALPLCPCPEGKWQPPFKASQMVYSEFPEDRGRSLNLFSRRKDVSSSQRVNHAQNPPHIPKKDIKFGNRVTSDYDDRPSRLQTGRTGVRGHSSGADYVDQPSYQYTDKDYDHRLRNNQNYIDYDDGVSSSHEGGERQKDYSSENSAEYVDQYSNGFNEDYKDKKSKEDDDNVEPNFTLEDFELDPEVMNPPPPLSTRPPKRNLGVGPADGGGGAHDEVHEPTVAEKPERPHINQQVHQPLEHPHHQIEATSHPLLGSPLQLFQNPALSQMTPSQPGWGRWKNVLAQTETSNLQVMKPPPLGQAQTWGKIINNRFVAPAYDTGPHEAVQYPKRILVPQVHKQLEHQLVQQHHYSKKRGVRAY